MNLPLAQSYYYMNPTIANRHTSNYKPFYQSNSAAEMILPCLAYLYEILYALGRQNLSIDLLLM